LLVSSNFLLSLTSWFVILATTHATVWGFPSRVPGEGGCGAVTEAYARCESSADAAGSCCALGDAAGGWADEDGVAGRWVGESPVRSRVPVLAVFGSSPRVSRMRP
jgi:hypothetical protein